MCLQILKKQFLFIHENILRMKMGRKKLKSTRLLKQSGFVSIFKEHYSKVCLRYYMVFFITTQSKSLQDAVNHCDLVSEVKLVQFCCSNCFQLEKTNQFKRGARINYKLNNRKCQLCC